MKPETNWVIDCGHWHCVDRYDNRHGHTITPDACPECAEERPKSETARELEQKALRIGSGRHPELAPNEQENEQ